MDLLEENNLLLQCLNPSLKVQPGQSGIVDILDTNTQKNTAKLYSNGKKVQQENRMREV